jgi:hypothetical protein
MDKLEFYLLAGLAYWGHTVFKTVPLLGTELLPSGLLPRPMSPI